MSSSRFERFQHQAEKAGFEIGRTISIGLGALRDTALEIWAEAKAKAEAEVAAREVAKKQEGEK